eukprot:UN18075
MIIFFGLFFFFIFLIKTLVFENSVLSFCFVSLLLFLVCILKLLK